MVEHVTWLTTTFGLDVPLVAAPMGGVANGAFAAEVSRQGAMGMLAAGSRATAEMVATESESLRQLGLPWGIGLLAWAVELRPELIDAVVAARPRLVSISYGPYQHFLDPLRSSGALITTQVGSTADAVKAEELGLDLLVVRGREGGGHGRDQVATMPLLQSVLEQTSLPVVAAGGITGKRGLEAVLAAGAVGAWVGTPFLACRESALSDIAKTRVIAAGEGETVYTTAFDSGLGLPWPKEFGGRALRNRFSDTWDGREDVSEGARAEMALALKADDFDVAPIWAGESVASVDRVTTVKEVIDRFR